MLLFNFLQELIYFKDPEELLLRVRVVDISKEDDAYVLSGEGKGENLNPEKHQLNADVKAVTLHLFKVELTPEGWHATVVLDI